MKVNRTRLQDDLEAYVLDLLDEPTTRAFEDALAEHPDLATQAADLQRALTALAYEVGQVAPPPLRLRVLDAALDRRPAGRDEDGIGPATAVACYREVVAGLRSLVDDLTPDDVTAPTVYRISVVELVRHLSGMEVYLAQVLEAHADPAATPPPAPHDHRAVRDDSDPERWDDVAASWRRSSDRLLALTSTWEQRQPDAPVQLGALTLPADAVLIARAFELWTHSEDICRATGRPPVVPSPAVLHAMADTAVQLLVPVLAQRSDHVGRTVRVTLTGAGGGSWVRRVPGPGARGGGADDHCAADATLVADVVDFCRLVADRIHPDGLLAQRLGDDDLVDELVRIAPTLADFGAGPLPR